MTTAKPPTVRSTPTASRIDTLVTATPATRDRTVDLLRAISIAIVVLWHWVFSVTYWNADGALTMPNPIDTVPGLWALTWVLQIMPLFFFVGGFANSVAWNAHTRRGGTVGEFVRSRLVRLGKPIAVLVAVWTAAELVLHLVVPGYPGVWRWGFVVFVPLWFLAVYAAVIVLTPVTFRLHTRAPRTTLVGMGTLVVLVDVARFASADELVGFVNALLVFVFVHQLGYCYGDGSLTRGGRRVPWTITLVGLGALVLLTGFGPYPRSMVAVRGQDVSNMFPPNACIAALGLFQAGLALLLRPALNRWLAKPGPWKAVIAANSVSMTVFAWHMTAYVLAIATVELVGGRLLADPTAGWWIERPLWLLLPAVFLAGLIAVFGRFELPTAPRAGQAERTGDRAVGAEGLEPPTTAL